MNQPNNWGRWGDDDQRGTANFITPAVTARAASLVRAGRTYPLAIPLKANAPIWPTRHKNWHVATYRNLSGPGRGGGEDILMMHTHGTTHIDALCHVFAEGKLYNGYPADSWIDATGARKNAISELGSLVTRGVLLDVAGFHGCSQLAADHAIDAAELESVAAKQGVSLESGDVVLVRTGFQAVWKEDPQGFDAAQPGITLDAAQWAGRKEIVALGSDNSAVEIYPTPDGLPVHTEFIWRQGGYLIELLDLDALARDAVYEFMFVLAPLNLARGMGSPVNPLAIC